MHDECVLWLSRSEFSYIIVHINKLQNIELTIVACMYTYNNRLKALKCKTLGTCVAWEVVESSQIAHLYPEVHINGYLHALLKHTLDWQIPLGYSSAALSY